MEQRRDVINPGRYGTMDEHFRVGIPQSIGHPSYESKGVVNIRAAAQLATPVDVKLPVFDMSLTSLLVTTGACTISGPLHFMVVVVATLDAMREPVKVVFPVTATPTCLVASKPHFTAGLNREHKAAGVTLVETVNATNCPALGMTTWSSRRVGNGDAHRQDVTDLLGGAEERGAARIGKVGVPEEGIRDNLPHRPPELGRVEVPDREPVPRAGAGTTSGGGTSPRHRYAVLISGRDRGR